MSLKLNNVNQVKEFASSKFPVFRMIAAENGESLDVLINDEEVSVRCAVANQGYGLERLASDPSEEVRKVVVKKGYRIEQFLNDESALVRSEIRTTNL